MDEQSKRRKWRRWLALVTSEWQHLQEERQLYAELREHIAGKSEWVVWIDTLYLIGVSLAIRRLADANPRHRTVSLVKLLQEMEMHPNCLSRRSALQQAKPTQRAKVHLLFDQLAGEGATSVSPVTIRRMREEFEQLTAPFRAWVDHCVAHHDLAVSLPAPDRTQVEEALVKLQRILETLWMLLCGGDVPEQCCAPQQHGSKKTLLNSRGG
ncbi:MAG: hypothetical protein RMK92_03400 [Armatimonadota bacterium]|nr:hypothetical protein [Armatimonadota bacterium]